MIVSLFIALGYVAYSAVALFGLGLIVATAEHYARERRLKRMRGA